MREDILNGLRANNYPRGWDMLKKRFEVDKFGYWNGEPVYKFYHVLTDGFELSLKPISIQVMPVESYIPNHIHNYVEIIIPLKGSCTFVSKDEKILIEENDIIVIGKYTPHCILPIEKDTVVVNISLQDSALSYSDLNFMLNSDHQSMATFLLSILENQEEGEGQYSLFRTNGEGKIINLIYDLIEEYEKQDIQSNSIIRFSLLMLFSRLIRQHYHSNIEVSSRKKHELSTMSLLIYIEQNYATITLDSMADHFGFNPNYLSNYLKKQTGKTFIKLVHLQRVNVAAEYLKYTQVPIEKISLKIGYENPSYFYKIFRKTLGVSPTEFRKAYIRK